MTRSTPLSIGLLLGVAVLMAIPLPAEASNDRGPQQILRFRGADQWSAPRVTLSSDRHEMTLHFRSTPKRIDRAVQRLLSEKARRVVTHATVVEDSGKTRIHLTLARRLATWKRKKYGTGNWLVRIELDPSAKLPNASLASLFPSGLERIVAEESERMSREGTPDCGGLSILEKRGESWSPIARLLLAECWNQSGKKDAARRSIRTLIRSTSDANPLAALAAMRANQWGIGRAFPIDREGIRWPEVTTPVSQETALRIAQNIYSRNLEEAIDLFLQVTEGATLPEELIDGAQTLRFDLAQRAIQRELLEKAERLSNAMDLPNPTHPVYEGLVRASALIHAQQGAYTDANALLRYLPALSAEMGRRIDSPLLGAVGEGRPTPVAAPEEKVESTPENTAQSEPAKSLTPPIKKLAFPLETTLASWQKALFPTQNGKEKEFNDFISFDIKKPVDPRVKIPEFKGLASTLQ